VLSLPLISISYGGSKGLDEALMVAGERMNLKKLFKEEILRKFMPLI